MNDKSLLLSKKPMVIIGIVVSIIIIIGGYIYYTSEKDSFREEKFNELSAISNLKINQILKWRKERIADVKVTTQSEFFGRAVAQWISNRDNLILKKEIEDRLKIAKTEYFYENISLADTKGELLLSVEDMNDGIDSIMKKELLKSVGKKKIIFSDFYKCQFDEKVHLTISSPLIKDNEVFAVLVFIIDPNEYIFPLIQNWPTPSKTAETIMLRKDGESVLFVNKLRHRKDTALKFRIPLTEKEIPAVQSVSGYEGIFEGKDYRGEEVLADLNKIPDSPWFMVSKIDQSEVYSKLRYRTGVIIGFVSLLIFMLSIGLGFIYNNRQADTYQELYLKEKELGETQEEFRTTLYSIGDGVITTDIYGNVRYMNHVAEELTGWREFDASGKPLEEVFKILNEETGDKVENPVDKILREGVVIGLANHTILIHKKGKQIPIADSGAPIYNENKKLTGVVLVFRDQTEEREAAKALRESEARLSNALEIAHLGHWEYDVVNDLFVFSDQFYKIFKTSAEQVGGYTMHSADYAKRFVHPDDMHLVGEETRKAIETKDPDFNRQIEHRILYPDGMTGYITVRFFVIKDEKGNTVKTYGVNQDITERKQAEIEAKEKSDQLKSLSEELELIIDSIPGLVFYKDTNNCFIRVNKYVADGYKTSKSKLEGMSLFDLHTKEQAQAYYEDDLLVIRSGQAKLNIDEHWENETGLKWVNTSKIPYFNETGKVIGVIGISMDVTEIKQAELEILKSREKLRNLSSHLQTIREDERGKISREIHDDLGQSLTALKMDMSWFKKNLHDDNSEKKIKGMIELVDETVKSVQRISTELRPGVLDDIGFSAAVRWFMNEYEERSGLKCKLEIKPDEIILDEKLSIAMYRIFQESLTNIMRHANATEVKVNIKLIKNELSLVVEDNGVGIDEEKLKDPKSIGLIGMQERVYPWHGNVEITGEKGKGTKVHVNVKF